MLAVALAVPPNALVADALNPIKPRCAEALVAAVAPATVDATAPTIKEVTKYRPTYGNYPAMSI